MINTVSSDYATLGETPQGIAMAGTTLYVSTMEGNIYKITTATFMTPTAVTKMTSSGISNLHGLASDGTTLFYAAGQKTYKVGVNQDPSTQSVSLIASTDELSDAATWKDVSVIGNWVYIADSTQASGATEGSCIYRVLKNGDSTGYEVYAGNAGEWGNLISDPDTTPANDARLSARFKNPVALAADSVSYANPVLYIADIGNKNIRMINGMDLDSGRVHGINVDSTNPLNVFEPRALAVSPGGQVLYAAASSEYRIKKIYLDGRANAVENITLAGAPWAIYDLKVLQEKYVTEAGEQWFDRLIFAFEVNKTDWSGRISVYDLKDGSYSPLIGPAIPKLGEFTGAMTLNSTGTKMWITSRNLNEGSVYSVDLVYNESGRPSVKSGVMDSLSIFIKKTGFFPAGIAYVKDPTTYAEYIVLGYYEGANILTTNRFKMARITLNWGLKTRSASDINPIVPGDLTDGEGGPVTDYSLSWNYLAEEVLTPTYYAPRAMTAAGRYVYWSFNQHSKVFSMDATSAALNQTPESAFSMAGVLPIYCTGFTLDPLGLKFFFANDLINQVYGN